MKTDTTDQWHLEKSVAIQFVYYTDRIAENRNSIAMMVGHSSLSDCDQRHQRQIIQTNIGWIHTQFAYTKIMCRSN